jgi:predicted nucleotide-binding protein
MRTVFISYSSKDRDFAERLAADLRASGVGVWFDQWEIKVGDSITQKINDGIHDNDYLAVVLSPDSVASDWVRKSFPAFPHMNPYTLASQKQARIQPCVS